MSKQNDAEFAVEAINILERAYEEMGELIDSTYTEDTSLASISEGVNVSVAAMVFGSINAATTLLKANIAEMASEEQLQ